MPLLLLVISMLVISKIISLYIYHLVPCMFAYVGYGAWAMIKERNI